jgi:hypothetical protein
VCAVAALLPDLDHHGSLASNWLRSGLTLVAIAAGVVAASHTEWIAEQPVGAGLLAGLAALLPAASPPLQVLLLAVVVGVLVFLGTSVVTQRLEPWHWVEHRGPLHAPIMVPLVGGIIWLLVGNPPLGLAVGAGWASHLLADAPTYRGLPLLWPYSKRMLHLTPAALRWHSGAYWIEWPLALMCLAFSFRLAPSSF